MRISELIEKLQLALEESGDEQVNIIDSDGNEFEVSDVSLDGWISITEI